MIRYRAPIPFLALFALCRALAAGVPAWEAIDFKEPMPGHCVAAQGGLLLAGDAEGLRESLDSGETWNTVASLPGSGPVHALLAAEASILAVRTEAIYRSTDSGRTWSPTEEIPYGEPPYRFQRGGDSLFLLGNRFLPHARMLSLDQGRTWSALPAWDRDLPPMVAEAQPGILFRLDADGLSQSSDGGGAWTPCPWDTLNGPIAALAVGQGNLYVTTGRGILLRRGIRNAEWHLLIPALRAGVPLALAAGGPAVCAFTALGVSCSRDAGGHFSFLSADTYTPPASDIAVDGNLVYLARGAGSRSLILSHSIAGPYGPWGEIKNTLALYPRMAARPGLLLMVISPSTRSRSLLLSRDQGETAELLPPATDDFGFFSSTVLFALGKRRWALASIQGILPPWARPVFRLLSLSEDSGHTYRRITPAPRDLSAMGISDSSLIGLESTGRLWEYGFRDSAWSDLPAPGGGKASALAVSDSIMYAYSDGKLWRSNAYDTPVGIRAVRAKRDGIRSRQRGTAEFARPGEARRRARNALGKALAPEPSAKPRN
jgi:hypothetical protein